MPILILQLPNFPPVEHVLKDEAVTIGRMKGNVITLDDISVSLSHAKLTRRDGEYYLKDLNSTNGTMVNGQSITEARLRDGDHVKFGEVVGRFSLTAAPSMVTSPTTPAVAPTPAPAIPAPPPPSPAPVPAPPAVNPPEAPVVASKPITPRPAVREINFKPSPVPRSSWQSLALKIGGLVVIALLLWKIAFRQDSPPRFSAAPQNPPATPAKAVPGTDRPPIPALVTTPPAVGSPVEPTLISLMQSLKSPDVLERRRAVAALNAMHAAALPAAGTLREALKDSDFEVRMWSALSLISNRVYDKACVPILIQTLRHENPTLRQVACLSLALVPYDDSEKDPVITALTEVASNDSSQEVRNAALSALKMVAHDATTAGK